MYVYRNIKERSCNHYRSGNAISATYSKCVSVVCPGLQYFSTLSHKRHDCSENRKLLNTVRFGFFFL